MSNTIFTVPGLMEIQSPISDAIPPIHRLPGYSRANSQWDGIPTVGPYQVDGAPPTASADRAFMLLSLNSDMSCPFYTLDSLPGDTTGDVTITDSAAWEFSVPAQTLPLRSGLWYWSFRVLDSEGNTREIDAGRLMVRP